MEPVKISFGFSKINKKSIIIENKIAQKSEANKVELIKCLEGQEIKLVEEKPEEAPLVIPLKESQKTSAALASLMKRRAVLLGEDEPMETSTPIANGENADIIINETEDIEKRAAKELLAELSSNNAENIVSDLVLPVVHPDDLPLEGAKESSLDDYDDIPIEQFGKAMLRGMGWSEPPKPAKGGLPLDDSPMVRPKGMGLGADKALKAKPLLVAPESNEVLQIKRNAFVRILGGKHKDLYGQIEGFDDHAGRVIVKMAIGGYKEAFNEFLCQPISKKEYAQYGKCINSTKYEEYKKKENEHGQIILKKEEIAEITKKSIKYEKIKREKVQELSSDDDCNIVERKPLKAEVRSGSREKTYHENRNIKEERNYKREYKREDDHERSGDGYKEERSMKRENTRGFDGDRKRDDYTKDGKNRDGQRYKERGHEDSRERNRNTQKDSYERNRNKGSDRNRERSRDRYESKYYNEDVERRRDSTKDNASEQRRDYRDREYDERKSRQTKADGCGKSDRNKCKKSSKDKKSKKKSKKSKKSKSKYRESSDSESSSSSSSNSSDSEDDESHKKHKKKSKEERGRSRSRGRR